jgi:hypothetical protein
MFFMGCGNTMHDEGDRPATQRFVERVKKAGLRGLVFNKVWSG